MTTFKQFLVESYDYDSLKKSKIALTDKERSQVTKAGAVWHHGPNGEETPAVWKSKDKAGNVVYGCNTHRAGAVEKTLDAAIKAFHSYVKDSA